MSDFDATEFDDMAGPSVPAHFYFHVPFCASKCSYCDFNSYSDCDPQLVFAMFAGMEAEMTRWSYSALPGVIETLYVGGGTPSLHAAPVGHLVEELRHLLPVCDDAEITVEGNPDSLNAASLEALLDAGVNRVSVGVQAFDDRVLKLLGRIHDASQARKALALVERSGVDFSVDLICGVPGQSMASWAESLEQALDSGAKHLSVYPLAIEEGTPLAAAISGGLVAEPDPDAAAEMMLLAEARLARDGILRYEVANYAAPGHESRHNTAYWTGEAYVGTGPGAHGMLTAATARAIGIHVPVDPHGDVARVRYAAPAGIESWLRACPLEIELLSSDAARREDVMLGMRLVRGVRSSLVAAAGLEPVLQRLAADGLVELAEERWRTTQRGWLLGNEVFGRVWNAE